MLIASIGLLTCQDARDIISDVRTGYSTIADADVIQTVKDATEPGCDWDANAD
tara:strand:- start:41 stop:199 length:159 start_codon:yes stop_codon:yes gene_type:complete